MENKKRGGKREGAGRKPTFKKKVPVTIYIYEHDVELMGGVDSTRDRLYSFVNGGLKPSDLIIDNIKTSLLGQNKPLPDPENKKEVTFAKPKKKGATVKFKDLGSKVDYIAPTEESYDGKKKPFVVIDEMGQMPAGTFNSKPEPPKSDGEVRPRNLVELKALCPPEFTGFERSEWVSKNRLKYNI